MPAFLARNGLADFRLQQALERNVHACLGLFRRDSRLQSSHHLKPHVHIGQVLCRSEQIAPWIDGVLHHHGHPKIGKRADGLAKESRWSDANNLEGHLANLNGLAKRRRVQRKALLPKRVAEHRDRRAASGAVGLGWKEPASGRTYSKSGEVVSADKAHMSGFLLRSATRRRIEDADFQLRKTAVRGKDFREDVVVVTEEFKL